MQLFSITTADFDGTTVVNTATASFKKDADTGVFQLTDGAGNNLAAVGYVPVDAFAGILGDEELVITRVSHDASAGVTQATMAIADDLGSGTYHDGAARQWNPANVAAVLGLPLPTPGSALQLDTNANGAQTIILEVGLADELSEQAITLYQSAAADPPAAAPASVVSPAVIAATTAAVGQIVLYDASGGTFQIDLPASAVEGDRVILKEAAADATAITISGNGNDVEDLAGALGASFTYGVAAGYLTFVFDATASEWRLINVR